MTYPMFKLISATLHGDFTVGKYYPRISVTTLGNGGERGFYWDNNSQVRMLPVELFDAAPVGEWHPPAPHRYCPNKELAALAKRWGVTKQSVYGWQRSGHPIRWRDMLLGATLPRCDEPLTDFKQFCHDNGFYVQELAVRWSKQQFGQSLADMAADPRRCVMFWDMFRGMMLSGERENV